MPLEHCVCTPLLQQHFIPRAIPIPHVKHPGRIFIFTFFLVILNGYEKKRKRKKSGEVI